ncbi:baculoviral IAP repeat-containing protein 1-like isoform X2 [Ascaphus truei]|uniref:baculoviral IAP repeat-containing protein 1-like isoform X2 n=1 Tax=Ascaphus truei TaxID=8439 RepID=UPI003F5A128E
MALALGSLVHLEELRLPTGEGMAQAAKLFIAQLQKLPNLRILILLEILNDESILELARAAKNGYLKGLRQLDLKVNVSVTESGWRTCFQTADNMPELCKLDLGRMYTHQIKCHATTVKSFVQFVSRLPSLVTIVMHGWLLDADDLNMFNRMKDKHPQSKSLHIVWQWFLPGSPNIEQ